MVPSAKLRATIRSAKDADMPAILDIWLDASKLAHDFIPLSFWTDRVQDMERIYLPHSKTFVLETGDCGIVGFLSLVDDNLAALFVSPESQGRGYGRQLLSFAQDLRSALTLSVYNHNERAVRFYASAGFRLIEERVDPTSGFPEMVMTWSRSAD
jgi:putative acetyltransferase